MEIYNKAAVVWIVNVSQASLWNPYARGDMWRTTVNTFPNPYEICWISLQLTVCVFLKLQSEVFFREIISINVPKIINQYRRRASCLSVNDSGSFASSRCSLSLRVTIRGQCLCQSQWRELSSASARESEIKRTNNSHYQQILINWSFDTSRRFPSSFPPCFLPDSTLNGHFIARTSPLMQLTPPDSESSLCDSLCRQTGHAKQGWEVRLLSS